MKLDVGCGNELDYRRDIIGYMFPLEITVKIWKKGKKQGKSEK